MTIAQRSIQTHIRQLSSPHMLLLGSNVREDYLAILESHLLGCNMNIGLSNLDNMIKTLHLQ